jgi:uncharacterized damage-inducible protein DinB
MPSDLAQAWQKNNELNLFLLDAIPEGALEDRYADRTRTIAAQFAHIHGVRLAWLKAGDPEMVRGLIKFTRGTEPGREELRVALTASADAMTVHIERGEAAGRVRGWQGSPSTFLGYFLAHEAHHRGLIMVALRLSGHRPPQEVVYGLWDWQTK